MSGARVDAPSRIRILVVDDHEVVRHGVESYLETQPDLEVVGSTGSGEEAIRLASELRPEVAFVDLIMPKMDGVEVTRQLAGASPTTRVVVLSSYYDDEHVFPVTRAGALSYLLKDVSPEGLADAARRAVRGEAVIDPRVAARMLRQLQGRRRDEPNLFVDLTEREIEVLRQVAEGDSNAAIAATLGISEKTVKRHASNIFLKLRLTDRTQAAVLAWRHGLVRRS